MFVDFYALPRGCAWRTYAGRRYCYYGGLYYYPYVYGGKTVYINIEVNSSGHPMAPPPSSQVIVNVN